MASNRCSSRLLTVPLIAGLVVFLAGPVVLAAPVPGALTCRPRLEAPMAKPLAPGSEMRTKAGERRRLMLPGGAALYVNENTTLQFDTSKTLALSAGEIYVEASGKELTVRAHGRDIVAKQASFAVRIEKQGPAVRVTRGNVAIQGVNAACERAAARSWRHQTRHRRACNPCACLAARPDVRSRGAVAAR